MTHDGVQPTVPRGPLKAYVTAVGVGAVVLLYVGYAVGGLPTSWGAVAVLSALAVLSWLLREPDVGGGVNLSFTSIILLSAAAIVAPLGAGIVGLSATLVQRGGQPFIGRVFNASISTLLGVIGGLTYRFAGGAVDIAALATPWDIIVYVGLPLMVADIVHCVVNAVLIAGVMQASRTGAFRPLLARMLTTTGPVYVGYGLLGFLFVVLWIPAGVGWFSSVLILAPLFVARWAIVQYGEEQRAHENTLRALVSAVDLKNPGAGRHSIRVAQLSEWTAEILGLGPRDIQDVRTAALLHDLGLIAVPTRVLRQTSPSQSDAAILRGHPIAGVAMLRGIAFLHGALSAVRHHHERVDGRGYPDGLSGDEIPLGARIVAAADALDALTSARADRAAQEVDEAVSTLRSQTGTQFDAQVVEALVRAIRRHGWTTTPAPTHQHSPTGWDHDLPESSDLLARRVADPAAVTETTTPQRGPAATRRGAPERHTPEVSR